VVWILPALLLGAGIVVAVVSVSRWTGGGRAGPPGATGSAPPGDELGAADRRLLERALAAHGEEDE
jgi:hypothetical protein